jgi:hypothetical protein
MLAREIAIGFGIAIVFPLLIYYGVSTFTHRPQWNDYHKAVVYNPTSTPEQRRAALETQKAETAAYTQAERAFSFRLLCIAAPLGYIAIVFGALRPPTGLHVGLMFGGIFAIINGYWSHWAYLEDWLRFVSLLVAMAVLMLVAYRRFPSTAANPWSPSDSGPPDGQ